MTCAGDALPVSKDAQTIFYESEPCIAGCTAVWEYLKYRRTVFHRARRARPQSCCRLSGSLETSTDQAIQALLNGAANATACTQPQGCVNMTFVGAKIPSLLDQVCGRIARLQDSFK